MRLINSEDLPSKGLFGKVQIPVEPVKYGIISANKNLPSKTCAERMYKDFQIYIKTIENWQKLCSFDYSALVFLKKFYTIYNSENEINIFTVTCPYCGNDIIVKANLMDTLEFPDMSDVLENLVSVKVSGTNLRKQIPTMEEFEQILQMLVSHSETLDEPEIMLRAFLGFVESPTITSQAIYDAVGEDVVLLSYLEDLCSLRAKYAPSLVCSRCKEVVSVARSDYFVTDPFRAIRFNFEVPKGKIIFPQNLQPRN